MFTAAELKLLISIVEGWDYNFGSNHSTLLEKLYSMKEKQEKEEEKAPSDIPF